MAELFHLHFNAPDVERAADGLAAVGLPCSRRFGSVRGDGVALDPDEPPPEGFRFKLQVHERGLANVTLGAGRSAHFDHVGVRVDDLDDAVDRARERDWSVRSNEHRTFLMTPWGFRVELRPASAADESAGSAVQLDDVVLELPDAEAAAEAIDGVVGSTSALSIRAGDEPWVPSFSIVAPPGEKLADATEQTVDVATLLRD